MSKSLGNAIGIQEAPLEMYGKLMSISDEMMWRYYELLTDVQVAEIEKLKLESHPMESKKDLARRVISDFHSAEAAAKAAEDWAKQFQKGGVPDEVEEVEVEAAGSIKLDKLLVKAKLAESGSDAVRKLKQKSVRVNGEVVSDPTTSIPASGQVTLQVGRKIKKVSFVVPADR